MVEAHLLIIDPQKDFMDMPGSALPVTGAVDDMRRVAKMISRIGPRLADIHVTLDSHQVVHVAHPPMWVNKDGKHPAPFTMITSRDVEAEIWRPRNALLKPKALGGQTLQQFMLTYTKTLEQQGKYALIIWPPHCIVGSEGYAIQQDLETALEIWADTQFSGVDFMAKGITAYVEHYGALIAEVPLPTVPETGLNSSVLDVLAKADIIGVGGEALSHCVMSTVNQIADNIGEEHIAKFHILVDASSPVPQPPNGPNFPEMADEWLHKMEKRGMTLTTTEKFLA